jgi:hypothetical protein
MCHGVSCCGSQTVVRCRLRLHQTSINTSGVFARQTDNQPQIKLQVCRLRGKAQLLGQHQPTAGRPHQIGVELRIKSQVCGLRGGARLLGQHQLRRVRVPGVRGGAPWPGRPRLQGVETLAAARQAGLDLHEVAPEPGRPCPPAVKTSQAVRLHAACADLGGLPEDVVTPTCVGFSMCDM